MLYSRIISIYPRIYLIPAAKKVIKPHLCQICRQKQGVVPDYDVIAATLILGRKTDFVNKL